MKSSRKYIENIFQKIIYFVYIFYLISHRDTPIDMVSFIQKSPEMNRSRAVHSARYLELCSTPSRREDIDFWKFWKSTKNDKLRKKINISSHTWPHLVSNSAESYRSRWYRDRQPMPFELRGPDPLFLQHCPWCPKQVVPPGASARNGPSWRGSIQISQRSQGGSHSCSPIDQL